MPITGAILDVDGTILRGSDPIPGADVGSTALADRGVRRLFCSNNPTKKPTAYAERFANAGFDVDPDEVLTSGTVTVSYLAEHRPDEAVFLVGESGLREQLADAGLRVVDEPDAAETVVVSVDRGFDYDRLTDALWALSGGRAEVPSVGDETASSATEATGDAGADDVAFVGTDPDVTIPGADRPVPGSGAIVRAVAGVAEREPDIVLGKPSDYARDMALSRLGVPADECLVVGDRLDTDIALGARAGMTTALVLTGIVRETELEAALDAADVEPDYVLDSFAEVERVFEEE
ncbi:HAD-IIA family hydrolase [Halobium salinum]|uniref:HAD-IIA family hydrolase n=1 Tax=Halobium salinum TaxID=1364940 RepID=A0ABD5P6Z8_9EURY|nr:HAD-IIA family hydrolase [Halobium salinum]